MWMLFLAYHPDCHTVSEAHAEFNDLFKKFTAGNKLNNGGDIPRLWSLILNCKQVVHEGIEGDFAELGVWRGNTAAILASIASKAQRDVFLFDTFEGFSKTDLKGIDSEKPMGFADTSVDRVKALVGTDRRNCYYVRGVFPNSITDLHRSRKYSVVSLDCDLYQPMKAGLEFFYPRMSRGGILLLHDYSSLEWAGAKLAVDEFTAGTGEFVVLMPDKSGSAFLRKTK